MLEILGAWGALLIVTWALFDRDNENWDKEYYTQIPRDDV